MEQRRNEPLTNTHPEWSVFLELLKQTSENLAKQIAKDGEGATKLIEVNVHGMNSKQDSQMMAKTIVGSNLVKTADFWSGCKLGTYYWRNGSKRSRVPTGTNNDFIW